MHLFPNAYLIKILTVCYFGKMHEDKNMHAHAHSLDICLQKQKRHFYS